MLIETCSNERVSGCFGQSPLQPMGKKVWRRDDRQRRPVAEKVEVPKRVLTCLCVFECIWTADDVRGVHGVLCAKRYCSSGMVEQLGTHKMEKKVKRDARGTAEDWLVGVEKAVY